MFICIYIYTLCSSGLTPFQFSSCWVAPIFQLNGWMQDKTLARNESQSLLPLLCINLSLGQNIIPQSILSFSAHFLFTSSGLQSGSGEIFWDFSVLARGWSSAWMPVCLYETFSSLGSNACTTECFYNLRGSVIWVRANRLSLCVPASSERSLCVSVSVVWKENPAGYISF